MKTLIAATLILAASLAGAETKTKQTLSLSAPIAGIVTIGPDGVLTQPVDDDVASITILLDIDGYLLNTLAQKYSGLDPAFDHVSHLYGEVVNQFTAAVANEGPLDFAETRKSAKALFIDELLMMHPDKDKQ